MTCSFPDACDIQEHPALQRIRTYDGHPIVSGAATPLSSIPFPLLTLPSHPSSTLPQLFYIVYIKQGFGSGFWPKSGSTSKNGRFFKCFGINVLDDFNCLPFGFHTFGVQDPGLQGLQKLSSSEVQSPGSVFGQKRIQTLIYKVKKRQQRCHTLLSIINKTYFHIYIFQA